VGEVLGVFYGTLEATRISAFHVPYGVCDR